MMMTVMQFIIASLIHVSMMQLHMTKGSPPEKINVFFWALPELPPPPPSPQFGQLVPLILDVKNDVLARITEKSKDDYDNDVSDKCDHNFGTFIDVKI